MTTVIRLPGPREGRDRDRATYVERELDEDRREERQ